MILYDCVICVRDGSKSSALKGGQSKNATGGGILNMYRARFLWLLPSNSCRPPAPADGVVGLWMSWSEKKIDWNFVVDGHHRSSYFSGNHGFLWPEGPWNHGIKCVSVQEISWYDDGDDDWERFFLHMRTQKNRLKREREEERVRQLDLIHQCQ